MIKTMSSKGQVLKVIRERSGLTQARLAELAGVNYSLIAHLEAGRRRITPATAVALADALKVEAIIFFDGPNDEAAA